MLLPELLTSAKIQEFISDAFRKRLDALQVSTALHKAGYSNEERSAIMDYMALVPKFREKFCFDANSAPVKGKKTANKNAGIGAAKEYAGSETARKSANIGASKEYAGSETARNSANIGAVRGMFLLCDRLALEQSTAKDIGRWKANLWPCGNEATRDVTGLNGGETGLNSSETGLNSGETGNATGSTPRSEAGTSLSAGKVHDLCCGMGGDSFFLPDTLKIAGVDLDENRLAMYRYNMAAFGKEASTICADVREVARANDTPPSNCAQPLNSTQPLNGAPLNCTPSAVNGICTGNEMRADYGMRADYFTIDPARRALEGENQRDLRNLTPTLEEVVEISRHYRGGMAKLPPGYPPAEIPDGTEILYLGGHSDCRECLVLFGELAKHPDTVRAVIIGKAGETLAEWTRRRNRSQETLDDDLQEKLDRNDSLEGRDRTYRTATGKSDLPLGEIGKYIAEPAPVLIRSRLFNETARACDADAHLISEGIAYVSSDKPLPAPAFSTYEVLDHAEIATGAVRAMLKKFEIGKITLKLRGVKVDPDAETKRLKPKGKNSATLFYTRFHGEKVAILATKTKGTAQ